MKFFTQELAAGGLTSMVLSAADGALQISIQPQANSGCTITGGIDFNMGGTILTPQAIPLVNNNTLVLSASPSSPIDGLTITWVSGIVCVIIGF